MTDESLKILQDSGDSNQARVDCVTYTVHCDKIDWVVFLLLQSLLG